MKLIWSVFLITRIDANSNFTYLLTLYCGYLALNEPHFFFSSRGIHFSFLLVTLSLMQSAPEQQVLMSGQWIVKKGACFGGLAMRSTSPSSPESRCCKEKHSVLSPDSVKYSTGIF